MRETIEDLYDKVMTAVAFYCKEKNIHEVCFYCARECKYAYEEWDSERNGREFCSRFDDLNLY